MGLLVFLLVVFFPVAEIMVMAKVASRIGFWDTLILLIFSGILGVYLAKIQGKIALLRVQQSLAEGRAPTGEMLDGLLIFLGGILFLIPGFISDILGIFLLFPLTRWIIRSLIQGNIQGTFQTRASRKGADQAEPSRKFGAHQGDVQDAEIVE